MSRVNVEQSCSVRTFRRSLSGSCVTKASLPASSTVCALSDSSVRPTAKGVPGLLYSSW